MNKYELMVIIKADLAEEERKNLLNSINDVVTKNKGKVSQASIWSEKRKLTVPIKKHQEGVYYLVNFESDPLAIKDMIRAYKLNENVLRFLFSRL